MSTEYLYPIDPNEACFKFISKFKTLNWKMKIEYSDKQNKPTGTTFVDRL